MKRVNLLLAIFTFLSISLVAQVKTPSASLGAKVFQTIGLTEVQADYSRPSKKGRDIFGKKSLVPYGKLWRTGANGPTKITFSTDVMVEGKELKKGSYVVLTTPGKKEWDVHFYKNEGGGWSSYKEKTAVATMTVKSMTHKKHSVETFTIGFSDLQAAGKGTLTFSWDNVIVPIQINTNVQKTVIKNIDKLLAGPSTADYYRIGSYYHDINKDLETALKYVQKTTKGDNPRFWQLRKESLILADLKRYKEAIETAKKSLELAEKAKNNDYVKMNKDSIKAWKKMK